MTGKLVFQTERMTLHLLTEEDLEHFYQMYSDPITMYYYPQTYSKEESLELLRKIRNEYDTNGYGRWACRLKESGDFVGICGLKLQRNIDGKDEVEVGYTFNRHFWTQGLATEAAKATMEHARSVHGIQRLISLIRPENLPSRRVAEKNGLVPVKEVIHHDFVHLVYVSHE